MRAEGPRGLSDITRYCCQADTEKCTEIQPEHLQNEGICPKNAGADALSLACLSAGEEGGEHLNPGRFGKHQTIAQGALGLLMKN